MTPIPETAFEIAAAVRAGAVSASTVVERALARIAARDPALNCFTSVFVETARSDAAALDARIADGELPGPLAGVPFAVKNLFDVAGVTTLAGSIIDAERPAALQDAGAVERMKAAGAILVGALNMDEYAYGFTTENSHYGATRNPHDPTRLAGGSSGGSAAAVAAGMVPLTLGSDTNGSIRTPAAFCGVFGLKPTFGAITRAGVRPFVHSLDHVGAFARNARDLALCFDALKGYDAADPASADRAYAATAPALRGPFGVQRTARLRGWFEEILDPAVAAATHEIARVLGADDVELPGVKAARSAAFCITAAEGGSLHLETLRTRAGDYDPATRDRLLAGAMLPAHIVARAQRYRRKFLEEALELLNRYDVLITPAAPFPAPLIGQASVVLDGQEIPVRANAGMYAQPFSFIGLPALVVPILQREQMPVGVQLVAAPWREGALLRIAAQLERQGVIHAGRPHLEQAA